MTDDQPVSWRTLAYGTPVLSGDGGAVGEVREVLGSDAEDIFHVLRVRLTAQRRDVVVTSANVAAISHDRVQVGMTQEELGALPVYDEAATYHLASVGWLRRHLGWKQDSKSDEEPG